MTMTTQFRTRRRKIRKVEIRALQTTRAGFLPQKEEFRKSFKLEFPDVKSGPA